MFLGRVVGPSDPLWLPEDADKAVAWKRWERTVCSSCGTRSADWLDDDGKLLDPPPYELVVERCPGCGELGRGRKYMREHGIEDDAVFMALGPFDPDRPPPFVAGDDEAVTE